MSCYEIKVVHHQAPLLTQSELRRVHKTIDYLEKEEWKTPVYARLDRDMVTFWRKPIEELFGDFWASISTSEKRSTE